MHRLGLIAPLLLLGACDAEVRTPAEGDEKVRIAADETGQVKFDLPFAKGGIKLPAAMMSEADLDIDGVKMIPGGKLTGFNVDAGEGSGAKVRLSFTAPVAPAEAQRYFVEGFGKQGVEARAADGVITGKTRKGDDFVMRLAPDGSGTKGTIEIDAGR